MSVIGAQEASVMVAQSQKGSQTSSGDSSHNKASTSHPEKKCTHCGGDKHTRVGCYELIGYLDWWDRSKALQRNMSKSLNTSLETNLVSRVVSAISVSTFAYISTTCTKGYVLTTSSKKKKHMDYLPRSE